MAEPKQQAKPRTPTTRRRAKPQAKPAAKAKPTRKPRAKSRPKPAAKPAPKPVAKVTETPDLTEVEMVEILKTIARDGSNAAARIVAIRELRAMRAGEKPAEDSIAKLYEIGKPGLRTKAA